MASPSLQTTPQKTTPSSLRPTWTQINLFTGQPEAPAVAIDPDEYAAEEIRVDEGISLVKTEEGSQLLLSGFGLFLSKKSERLLVKKSNQVLYQFPFFRLSEVVVSSRGVSLSSDLVEEVCARGIRLVFLSGQGKPYAMITSPMLTATVQARREQILALNDSRGFEFCRTVVEGKIRNQERILRYFGKYLRSADPERCKKVDGIARDLHKLAESAAALRHGNIAEGRAALMGTEGTAGRIYWDGFRAIIGQKAEFFGREHHGATDAVNSLLNYGYGILYAQVWGAVLNAGLEPFAGFLHVDRPGKPSLVLDLVEEFRQPVVDRVVISFINLGTAVEMKDGMLEAQTRQAFAQKVLERLESRETYQGKKYQVRSIIQMQARRLASFLRGSGPYKTFAFKW